jgi:hypothetical protein
LRVRVAHEGQAAWEELVSEARGDPQRLRELRARFENEQFKNELLPAYRQMLDIFRDKFWLAEGSTREQFRELIVYIKLWERHLQNNIPPEVIARLDVTEAKLQLLYDDLEGRFGELRDKLSKGST